MGFEKFRHGAWPGCCILALSPGRWFPPSHFHSAARRNGSGMEPQPHGTGSAACLTVSPLTWAGQPCPAFLLLLLSSQAVCGHGGAQGQLAPLQTLAQGECNGAQRDPALEPVSWPRAGGGCVLPSVCNAGKVMVLFPQLSLSHLFRFKNFGAFVYTVAITVSIYPLPQDS